MSFRTTYILFGLLGALVLVFGLALWLAPATRVDDKYVLPSIRAGGAKVEDKNIVKVELERPAEGVEYVFVRDESKDFKLEKPAGYRINSSHVLTLVNQVLDAKTEVGDLSSNLKDWGLDKPHGKIKLTTDQKQELTVYLGDDRNDRVYVTSSDKPKTPMVLQKKSLDAAFSQLSDFRSRDLVALKSDDIRSIKVEKPAKEKTERVVLQSVDGKWRYEEPKYGAANLDSSSEPDAKGLSGVSSLLSGLTGLRAEGKSAEPVIKDKKEKTDTPRDKTKELGFWQNDAKDEDLKKFGLDSDASASLVLEVKKDPADKDAQKVLIGKETADKSGLVFARVWPERNVLTVAKKGLEVFDKLLADPQAVRDRDLVKLPEKPDVIRIKYPDGETIEMIRSEGTPTPPIPHPHGGFPGGGATDNWKLYLGKDKKGLNTDAKAIKNLIDVLVANKRQVTEFPDNPDDPALGLKDPNNLTISLWADGVKKTDKKEKKEERPELKSDTPDVELSFGRVDKKYVAVKRRTGKDLKQIDVVKVMDSVLDASRADSLAYLEKTLPSFFSASEFKSLLKLTADLDGKTTVAEKTKPEASDWMLKLPPEWAGRKADEQAVNGVVFGLNELEIARWEALKPTQDQLGRWGLRSPSSKITLVRKGEKSDVEVSLLIGGPTDDKKGYYAKKSDREEVFSIDKSKVERLKEPLLDLQVLKFPSDTVKAIKLTGWPRRGKPDVLELTRESATAWKGKDLAPNVKVHSEEVEKLLDALSNLRAKKFVLFKAGPNATHGMDPAMGALAIELTLEDKEKKTEKITLTLGNADADGFFAISNKLPGDVFTVAKGAGRDGDQAVIFEKLKKESEYLAK